MSPVYHLIVILGILEQSRRLVYANDAVGLPNVHCDTYLSYVETDTHYKHFPYIVKLYQCAGKNTNSMNFGCVATKYANVDVYVTKQGQATHQTVKMKNVTSCEERCLLNNTSCNPYQRFNGANCQCDCKQVGSPGTCEYPFKWDQHQCNCICPVDAETKVCEKRKSFNKEYCKCMCKDKIAKRCEKQNKLLDINTCKCIDDPLTSQSTNDCLEAGVSLTVVFFIVIAELLIIIILFFIFKRFCQNPKRLFISYCSTNSADAESGKVEDHKLIRNESLKQ